MRKLSTVLLCSASLLISGATLAGDSPYSGEETRSIKSLSEGRVDALQEGAGTGYGKTAELNGWPGPKHVIELADELNLSDGQLEASRTLFTEMRDEAILLGKKLLSAEQELEALFAQRSPSPESVKKMTIRIGELEGALRAVHLIAHVKQMAILDADQARRYGELRGYGDATPNSDHHH